MERACEWWTYLIAVIEMLNIGLNASEPRWDRMGTHGARLLRDGAGSLASVYSDHELFLHGLQITPETLAGQHEREFSVEQTNERCAYSTFTSTALAFGFSAFGRCTKRTPSLNSARSLSSATFSGKLKDRTKLP